MADGGEEVLFPDLDLGDDNDDAFLIDLLDFAREDELM
jgi:hypothetical protein